LQYYTEGNVPEGLMFAPKEWNADQVREFDSWFNSLMAGNTAEMRRIKFVPGGDGAKFDQLKPIELKSPFDEWLARIVCFAFSIPPSAFVSMMNRATAEQADETGKSEGLMPLVVTIENVINQMLRKWGGFDDIEFAFSTERAVDAIKQAEGVKQATILEAQGKAEAIRLVNGAAKQYFQGTAITLRQLEVARTPSGSTRRSSSPPTRAS
jgi:hypothetical protein